MNALNTKNYLIFNWQYLCERFTIIIFINAYDSSQGVH